MLFLETCKQWDFRISQNTPGSGYRYGIRRNHYHHQSSYVKIFTVCRQKIIIISVYQL